MYVFLRRSTVHKTLNSHHKASIKDGVLWQFVVVFGVFVAFYGGLWCFVVVFGSL